MAIADVPPADAPAEDPSPEPMAIVRVLDALAPATDALSEDPMAIAPWALANADIVLLVPLPMAIASLPVVALAFVPMATA
jgi:hypothetical protein